MALHPIHEGLCTRTQGRPWHDDVILEITPMRSCQHDCRHHRVIRCQGLTMNCLLGGEVALVLVLPASQDSSIIMLEVMLRA